MCAVSARIPFSIPRRQRDGADRGLVAGGVAIRPRSRRRRAGVRVSMLRPRFKWTSISAAAPIMRPYRKTVKAAVSRSRSVRVPDLKSFHSSASSSAAITASTLTQKT